MWKMAEANNEATKHNKARETLLRFLPRPDSGKASDRKIKLAKLNPKYIKRGI
jgi:hypothetical protein